MAIMTHAKFHFNWLMLTLIFAIWASEPPGPGERLKRPGLIGLKRYLNEKNLIHGRVMAMISKFSPQIFETYFRPEWTNMIASEDSISKAPLLSFTVEYS